MKITSIVHGVRPTRAESRPNPRESQVGSAAIIILYFFLKTRKKKAFSIDPITLSTVVSQQTSNSSPHPFLPVPSTLSVLLSSSINFLSRSTLTPPSSSRFNYLLLLLFFSHLKRKTKRKQWHPLQRSKSMQMMRTRHQPMKLLLNQVIYKNQVVVMVDVKIGKKDFSYIKQKHWNIMRMKRYVVCLVVVAAVMVVWCQSSFCHSLILSFFFVRCSFC